MKRTAAEKAAMKRPTRAHHGNGKGWPYKGKNSKQRNRLASAFMSMR